MAVDKTARSYAAFYLVGPSGLEKAIGTEELLASTELLKGFEIL